MKIRNFSIQIMTGLTLLGCAPALFGQFTGNGSQAGKAKQEFMRKKLVYSEHILEGLVLEKYDLVVTNAALLKDMSVTNAFSLVRNPEYLKATADFQQAVDRLAKTGEKKELSKAYDEYSKMEQTCVRCHQVFRREQHVAAERLKAAK